MTAGRIQSRSTRLGNAELEKKRRDARKAGLMLSIVLMFVGTLLIAVAPTAATIGVAAGIIILTARLLQGFSAGGEFASATAFLIEYAPDSKAFYGSWQVATQGAAILLAGLFGFVLNNYLSTQSLESWGWRIPFIFALAIGPVGWYIRTKMDETPEFLATAYFAPLPALMASIFPPQIRTTGMSLGYNIAVTVFGGFAPFILTWLIASTGSLLAPSFYLLAIAAVSLVSLTVVRRVYKES